MFGQIFYTLLNFLIIILSTSIRVTPFYAYRGYHPHWSVLTILELPTNPNAEDHLEQLQRNSAELSTYLHHAQQTQKDYGDRHRRPSYFDIGDRVWLLR